MKQMFALLRPTSEVSPTDLLVNCVVTYSNQPAQLMPHLKCRLHYQLRDFKGPPSLFIGNEERSVRLCNQDGKVSLEWNGEGVASSGKAEKVNCRQ